MDTIDDNWTEERITQIETYLLQGIFGCRTSEAVEAAINYAKYLSSVGITPENCPVFLRMLEIENHFVIDSLIGERDPFLLLSPVQPNKFILSRIFAMLTRWHKGGIYPKSLSVILGVLQSVYSSPLDGYRIYPLTIANLNALAKHLAKEKGQDDPVNRVILEVLDKIADLEDPTKGEMDEVAIQAAAVRNAFFDDRKKMEDVIPPVLLVTIKERQEVVPRTTRSVGAEGGGGPSADAKPATAKPAASTKSGRGRAKK